MGLSEHTHTRIASNLSWPVTVHLCVCVCVRVVCVSASGRLQMERQEERAQPLAVNNGAEATNARLMITEGG